MAAIGNPSYQKGEGKKQVKKTQVLIFMISIQKLITEMWCLIWWESAPLDSAVHHYLKERQTFLCLCRRALYFSFVDFQVPNGCENHCESEDWVNFKCTLPCSSSIACSVDGMNGSITLPHNISVQLLRHTISTCIRYNRRFMSTNICNYVWMREYWSLVQTAAHLRSRWCII